MTTVAMILACTTLAGSPAEPHPDRRQVECEKTRQKIRTIQSRMRQGYSRAEGERLAERLRELRAILAKQCR